MESFDVHTAERLSVTDVTDRVRETQPADADGTCTVFVQHTTAAVTVNEAERRLLGDIEDALSGLVAEDGWNHDHVDDNADAHLRAMFVGPTVTIPVSDGELALGTWQSVVLVECDGPRTRTVLVQTG
jgi:secondary thiamine-phosphate synthase enzyme